MSAFLTRIVSFIFGLFLLAIPVFGAEIKADNHSIYLGDLDGDGDNDFYFLQKPFFLILHGDIATPIPVQLNGFAVMGISGGYSPPQTFILSKEQIAQRVAAGTLRLLQYGSDYLVWNHAGNGETSVLLRPTNSNDIALLLRSSGSSLPGIAAVYPTNSFQDINNRSLALRVADINGDGLIDLIVGNGGDQGEGAYLANNNYVPATYIETIPSTTRPIITGTQVGSLAGEFRVNETGAATYSVPITIPDGVAGVKPSIAITYNSQYGNGLLGKGGSLAGISSISRCRQTLSQDGTAVPVNWTATDRFCMDGQRLMLIEGTYGSAGSKYRTEIDALSVITAFGGTAGNPDYFTVEAKDGSTSYFGGSGADGSEVLAGTSTLLWSIRQFNDSVGNPVNYVYKGNLTDHRISEIFYAYGASTTPGARIEFIYESRNDVTRFFVGGYEQVQAQRLKTIKTYNTGTTPVRIYDIGYNYAAARIGGQTRLDSMTECMGSLSNCYPATKFGWFDPVSPGVFEKDLGSVPLDSGKVVVSSQIFLDINGNGIQDYVWADTKGYIRYRLDIGVSNDSPVAVLESGLPQNRAPKFETLDYNGDGHHDLLVRLPTGWTLYLSTPTPQSWKLVKSSIQMPFRNEADLKLGDINSDGLIDVMVVYDDGFPNSTIPDDNPVALISFYKLEKNPGAAVTSPTYYRFSDATYQQLVVPTTEPDTKVYLSASDFQLADFNGDGKVDIIAGFGFGRCWDHYYNPYESPTLLCSVSSALKVFVNGPQGNFVYSDYFNHSVEYTKLKSSDLNGDGKPDIAFYDFRQKKWFYSNNNGNGFSVPQQIFVQGDKLSKNQDIDFVDINHDGMQDVVWRDSEYVPSGETYWSEASQSYESTGNIEQVTLYIKYWKSDLNRFGDTAVLQENQHPYYQYQFIDVNGDAWVDKVAVAKYGKATSTNIYMTGFSATSNYSATGFVPQSNITSITDGLGNRTSLNYEPISRSSHYVPIGGFKVVGQTATQCGPNYAVDDNGTLYDVEPLCEPVTTYSVNADDYYRTVNDPFGEYTLLAEGAIDRANLVNAPVLEATGPVSVVTKASNTTLAASEVEANKAAIVDVSVEYFYKHMRMQAAGRGMLGFEYIASIDLQTGVSTETRYRQDWPFVGSPQATVTRAPSGETIADAFNIWTVYTAGNAGAKRYQPRNSKTVERTFAWNSDGSVGTTPLQTVTTETTMEPGEFGNIDTIKVTTEGSDNKTIKYTDNSYFTTDWDKRLGRLKDSLVRITLDNTVVSEKTVRFEYYSGAPHRGLIYKEITAEGTSNQIIKEYEYDAKGNKVTEKVNANKDGVTFESRITSNVYDTNGRFLKSTSNSLNQALKLNSYNELGQLTSATDINDVESKSFYDAMGKEYLKKDNTGAWVRTRTSFCSTACPAGAKYFQSKHAGGGGASIEYFDSSGRLLRSSKLSMDGQWTNTDIEYDRLGRVLRKSNPFFGDVNTKASAWATTKYDKQGRITEVVAADTSKITNAYSGYTTTTTNHLGQTKTETRNGLGQLTNVKDNAQGEIGYLYNGFGEIAKATTKAGAKEFSVRICYDNFGRKTAMLDPDKGAAWAQTGDANIACSQVAWGRAGWWHYKYNGFGELIEQRDAKGQTTKMYYDSLGRMIGRTDILASGAVESFTQWFYEKNSSGQLSGISGKLTEVVVNTAANITAATINNALASGVASCSAGNGNCLKTAYQFNFYSQPSGTTRIFPGSSQEFKTSIFYDGFGRVSKEFDALDNVINQNGALLASGIQTAYNIYGYPEKQIDIGSGAVIQKVNALNANNQVTSELLGNGSTINRTYDSLNGNLRYQTAGIGSVFNIQNIEYKWDLLGNLKFRHNSSPFIGGLGNKNLRESFCYDGLNRLIKTIANSATENPVCSGAQDITYDAFGNINSKTGVGQYDYSGIQAGPHAVTSVAGVEYKYDANGNVLSGDSRIFEYTSYDMASRISKGASSSEFKYDADRARWKRLDTVNGIATETVYIGNVERIKVSGTNTIEWKRKAGPALFTYKTSDTHQLITQDKAFVYVDHLGSVDVITDAVGQIRHSLSFDPWGQRRSGENWSAQSISQILSSLSLSGFTQPITTRGYTGHEMVDALGIIHMNGRIYDPKIGRFLQADPFIQAATNTQSYNRYAYVFNNPLNATDPSGYFSLRNLVGVIVAIIGTYLCGPNCGMQAAAFIGGVSGMAQAAANGADMQGLLKGAFVGAVSGAAFSAVGRGFGASGSFASASAGRQFAWAFSQGMVGGTMSVMQGGKFGHGFASAFLTKYANVNQIVGTAANQASTRIILAAIIGGTVSEMTGGKFANGALSSALMQAVNGEKEANAAEEQYKKWIEFQNQMTPAQVVAYWSSGKGGHLYFGPESKMAKLFSEGDGAKAFEEYVYYKYQGNPPEGAEVRDYGYKFTWPRALQTGNLAEQAVGSWGGGAADVTGQYVYYSITNVMGANSLFFGRQLGEHGIVPVGKQASDLHMTIEWRTPLKRP